ncbi:MAG: ABC transporter, partial [Ruminococcus sp.]|nr:ABC transporter [Ruminococcus sp.]
GVKEITAIDDEGSSIYAFTVQTENDSDAVRDTIMADCIKNGISILEIYADKPNLESVFIELINRPVKKSGLEELLAETPDESGDSAEDESGENEEEKEEE